MSTNRWDEIEHIILNNRDELKKATTAQQIRDIADKNGIKTTDKADFGKYTHKLKMIGVHFYDLVEKEKQARQQHIEEDIKKLEEQAHDADTPTIHLWTAALEADNQKGSFAIVDRTGEAVWVNTFHPDDYTRKPGDIGSAEQSVAEKAVFLARKTQDETGDDILTLIIHTQYPELDVTDLKKRGLTGGNRITVTITVDDDNRALYMAQDNVTRNWKTYPLTTLTLGFDSENL